MVVEDVNQTAISAHTLRDIRGLSGDNGTLTIEVIRSYLTNALELIKIIQTSAQMGDLLALQQSTHTLKSTSAMLGALYLSECCQELEKIARMGNLDNIASKVRQLEAEYDRVKASLQTELQQCQR